MRMDGWRRRNKGWDSKLSTEFEVLEDLKNEERNAQLQVKQNETNEAHENTCENVALSRELYASQPNKHHEKENSWQQPTKFTYTIHILCVYTAYEYNFCCFSLK